MAGFGEVRAQQTLRHLVHFSLPGGEMRQAVCIKGVGGNDRVHVVGEPDAAGLRRHLFVHRFGLRAAHAVFGCEQVMHVALLLPFRMRIKLKAAVDDRDLLLVRKPLESSLKPTFADVAKRTDKIGPDFNDHESVTSFGKLNPLVIG